MTFLFVGWWTPVEAMLVIRENPFAAHIYGKQPRLLCAEIGGDFEDVHFVPRSFGAALPIL